MEQHYSVGIGAIRGGDTCLGSYRLIFVWSCLLSPKETMLSHIAERWGIIDI